MGLGKRTVADKGTDDCAGDVEEVNNGAPAEECR